jgi:hypothetical protein
MAINRSKWIMLDVSEMFVDRQSQRTVLHTRHMNEQLVRVLKTIGYDVGFQKGQDSTCSIGTAPVISTY